jgi:DNA-damage-inducible protein J
MAETAMLHVRVDEETKDKASEALAAMGLSISEAVRIFLKRVVVEQAIPFAIKVPNAATRVAMEEARSMGQGRFANAQGLFNALDAEGE